MQHINRLLSYLWPHRYYTCALCQCIFKKHGKEEAMRKEARKQWPDVPQEQYRRVCGECWHILKHMGIIPEGE